MPGEGIEPTRLSTLDFESSASIFSFVNQKVIGDSSNFAKSLQIPLLSNSLKDAIFVTTCT